jgi:hypothetical protein
MQVNPTPAQQNKMENCLLRRNTLVNFIQESGTWGEGAHPVADLICFYDDRGAVYMATDNSAARCTLNAKNAEICKSGADEGTCMSHITEGSNYKTVCLNDPSCQWETDSKTWVHGDPKAVSIHCTSPDENFAQISCDASYYNKGWWPAKINTPSPHPGQQCAFGASFKYGDGKVPVYHIDDEKTCPHAPPPSK